MATGWMKTWAKLALTLCAVPVAHAGYKSPDQLKSEFAGLLGPGRYARLAWMHCLGTDVHDWTDGNSHIYVLDTKDGVARKLTTALGDTAGNLTDPNITADGSRVVFCDNTHSQIYVVDWSGKNLRKLISGYRISRVWRDPANGSDWVIATGTAPDNALRNGFKTTYRINIDDTARKVVIWDRGAVDSRQYGFWASLSLDGTRLAATFSHDTIGWVNADNTGTVHRTSLNREGYGCWPNMARDGSYKVLSIRPDHPGVAVVDPATGDARLYDIHFPNQGGVQYVRWSTDTDLITHTLDYNGPKPPLGPIVQSLKDLSKYVSLQDAATFKAANTDMQIYTDGALPDIAPSIVNPGARNIDINKAVDIVIMVTGSPAPTLEAAGLPAGLALQNGAVPANAFHITGVVASALSDTVRLTAKNPKGADQKTFVLTAGAANQAPVVDAGADFSVRINRPIPLAGTVTDDGKPDPAPTIAWKQVAGPGNSTFSNAASQNTEVSVTKTGTYKYELSGYDGALRTADTVQVNVLDSVPFVVTKPGAGEQVRIGAPYTIQWNLDPAEECEAFLSRDDGATWSKLTTQGTVGDGAQSWTWAVPDTLAPAAQCRIKLVRYFVQTSTATSATFSLVKSAGIRALGRSSGDGWSLMPMGRKVHVEVDGTSPFASLRLLSSDGRIDLRRAWEAGRGYAADLALPPGLYIYELGAGPAARGMRRAGLLPVLR